MKHPFPCISWTFQINKIKPFLKMRTTWLKIIVVSRKYISDWVRYMWFYSYSCYIILMTFSNMLRLLIFIHQLAETLFSIVWHRNTCISPDLFLVTHSVSHVSGNTACALVSAAFDSLTRILVWCSSSYVYVFLSYYFTCLDIQKK